MPEGEPEAAVGVASACSFHRVHSGSLLAPPDSTAAMFWAGMLGVASAVASAVELTLAAVTVALAAETSGIELLLAPVVALEAETSGIELLLAPVAAALAAALELTDPDDGAKNVL